MKILAARNNITASLRSGDSVSTSKFLSLEAFRGLAAIMVVLYHSRFYAQEAYVSVVKHSHVFVDFFFILSGFVMAYSYLNKIGSKISFGKFILLRLGRLYPLHLFTLLLWVPYIAVKVILFQKGIGDTDPGESNNPLTFISNLFLVHALDGYQPLSWNYSSWSISAEFYTYIFFFFFILCLSKQVSSRTKFAVLTFLIAFSSYVLTWVLDGSGIELFLFQCIGGFFLGILIYLLYQRIKCPKWNVVAITFLELCAFAFMLFSVSNIQEQGFRGNIYFYVSILSFVLLISLFVVQEEGYISRFLKHPLFQFTGKLSYSIYMVHAIVLAGVENLFVYVFKFHKSSFEGAANVIVFNEANYVNIALIFTVLLFSAFTYQFIEIPWRDRVKRMAQDPGFSIWRGLKSWREHAAVKVFGVRPR